MIEIKSLTIDELKSALKEMGEKRSVRDRSSNGFTRVWSPLKRCPTYPRTYGRV